MGKDAAYILARIKARQAGKPIPSKPEITQHLAPAKLPSGPLPMANVLANDMFVAKTEWEWAQEKGLPAARINNHGPDLRKPLIYKGAVGQIEYLSKLTPEQLAHDKPAKAYKPDRFMPTVQERIAIDHIRTKIKNRQELTAKERTLWAKARKDKLVAIARLRAKGQI